MTQELMIVENEFMPALSVPQAVQRFNTLVEFVQNVMRRDVDYGAIPGTDKKPTLLKAGAEKLTTLFGLTVRFETIEQTQDWTGEAHSGEPFFYYWYRCQLWRGALLIAEADGSCNSRESKYRYRDAKRVCPACHQASIIKGKTEYGGGWLCFKKQGGCGAKYADGDQAIEGQPAGRPGRATGTKLTAEQTYRAALLGGEREGAAQAISAGLAYRSTALTNIAAPRGQ